MSWVIKLSPGPVRTKQREPPPRRGEHRHPPTWNAVPPEAAIEAAIMRHRVEPPPVPGQPERTTPRQLRPVRT